MDSTSGRSHLQSRGKVPFAGHVLKFSLSAEILHGEKTKSYGTERQKKREEKMKRQREWRDFYKAWLQKVCGARNTPDLQSGILTKLPRKDWWRYEIQLERTVKDFNYIDEFSDRVDDELHRLLSPRSSYPDVFFMIPDKSAIIFEVVSADKEFATLDYKTKQSTTKGLVPVNAYGLDSICYEMYQKQAIDKPSIKERSKEMILLQSGKTLGIYEDARLQFKRLQEGQTVNENMETGEMQRGECFDPEKPADHYVDWIWNKYRRGLGEYMSAFSKIEDGGGAIYYGINETKNHTGYEPVGLAIDAAKMEAVKKGICRKIRHEMLWIQRDPDTEDGYRELTASEIRCQGKTASAQEQCHFAVDFIEVQENSSSQATEQPSSSRAKFVLEVRVAPFNGVVFYDPQGPEAYRMEKEGEGFKPIRVSKEKWLAKMRDYGWCSKHKISKRTVCTRCESEQKHTK